jgi:hypothetical protein
MMQVRELEDIAHSREEKTKGEFHAGIRLTLQGLIILNYRYWIFGACRPSKSTGFLKIWGPLGDRNSVTNQNPSPNPPVDLTGPTDGN